MNGKYLGVSDHAIRRYRQRIGRKQATKSKLKDHIKREVLYAMQNKHYTKMTHRAGACQNRSVYRIFARSFTAIATRQTVLTVYHKELGGDSHVESTSNPAQMQQATP